MSKQISKIYHAAIYVRLSKEDGDVSTNAKAESNSISNQKDFIRNFLADKKDIRIVKEYVDDGYSGSNFDRPSFQTMMEDIKRGVIDCVVVKDLSRFGREYIDSGRYIERLFPALGVRFIAINDNYDSVTGKSQGDEIIIPFKNLINDAYCRDISIKIRSHLDVKRKNGEYIGAFVPYGYEKSEDDKHKLVIDTYAAGIVKEIFRLKLHGMSQDAIATQLNNEGVLAPMEYKQSTGSGYQTGFLQNEKSVWSSVTVRRILENEIYIGNLVQGKRTTPNHKVKQEVVKPESDWIRIEKNHEPIISDRDFEIVQRLLGMDTRISPDSDVVYNLSGIAVCADCGSPMTRKITTAGDKKYAYYICSNHKLTKQCSQHSISVSLLEDTVLEMLKLHIKNVMNLEEILDYIGTIPFQQLDVKSLEARKQKKLEEVEKCKRLKTSLYEDMKDGILTKEEYLELHEAYLKKAKEGEEIIRQIERDIALILEEKDDKHLWMNYFTEYKDIKELTRDVVVKLICEVRVSENKEVEIVFDFDDCYKQLLESVEKLGYIENEHIEVNGKISEVTLRGNKSKIEIDSNLDMQISVLSHEGALEINQLSATSRLTIPADYRFRSTKKGIATHIYYERQGKKVDDFSDAEADNYIELKCLISFALSCTRIISCCIMRNSVILILSVGFGGISCSRIRFCRKSFALPTILRNISGSQPLFRMESLALSCISVCLISIIFASAIPVTRAISAVLFHSCLASLSALISASFGLFLPIFLVGRYTLLLSNTFRCCSGSEI